MLNEHNISVLRKMSEIKLISLLYFTYDIKRNTRNSV